MIMQQQVRIITTKKGYEEIMSFYDLIIIRN